ncbi:hypothetical protein GA0115245_14128 [Streptomyces sp. di188]|nr:hypothetical protein GA0115238_12458 [Streptomyces sp. di50b]SCE46791.1 hypothetical protein GA0115245_14128 [Streptomyces sp. di188]
MSEGQASARSHAPVGRPLLSLTPAALMDKMHAHSGALCLHSPDQPVLEMAVMAGSPRAFAAPWERVGLSAPIPVSDARLRSRGGTPIAPSGTTARGWGGERPASGVRPGPHTAGGA